MQRWLAKAYEAAANFLLTRIAVLAWWIISARFRLFPVAPPVPPQPTRHLTADSLRRIRSVETYCSTARLRDLELDRPPLSPASRPHVSDPVEKDEYLSEAGVRAQERRFNDFLNKMFHGRHEAREGVIEHLAWCRISLDEEAANVVLDLWRRFGFDLGEGVGYFLDRLCTALAQSTPTTLNTRPGEGLERPCETLVAWARPR